MKIYFHSIVLLLGLVSAVPAKADVGAESAYFGRTDGSLYSWEVTLKLCLPNFTVHITKFNNRYDGELGGTAFGTGRASQQANGTWLLRIDQWNMSFGKNGGPRMAPQSLAFEIDELSDSQIRLVDMGCMHNRPPKDRPGCGHVLAYNTTSSCQ